ncbi:MAG: MFS transporter [Bacteroidaceae bacterium]
MSNKTKQWGAIIIMIALFAMIAFVTNLCSPMAIIVKNQFGASNLLAQIGNYGNFIDYLLMGIPSGMLIKKFGYKKTALLALLVGIIGILIQWMSGWNSVQSFGVYLIGAFVAGFCMCMLNTVVNPMLNILGGGGNKGNQLIQIGGVFNSSAAVAVYIIMGALIGDAAKAKIADVTPALFIALGIFIVGFIVILFTKIQEPQQAVEVKKAVKDPHSAFSFRHFNLGILAIFLYMGVEVGTPTYILQYLTSDTPAVQAQRESIMKDYEGQVITANDAAINYIAVTTDTAAIYSSNKPEEIQSLDKQILEVQKKIEDKEITVESVSQTTTGRGMSAGTVGLIVAVYWLMMLVGRFVGGAIGGKVSSRAMIITASTVSILLVAFGMFAPTETMVSVPGIDWSNLSVIWEKVPVGIFAFLLVGLCTSVMWGGIFNLATEGLGKYTAIASGAFMTMVFGCAIMVAIQALVADFTGSYLSSYVVVLFCAAYILYYALIGCKNVNKDIPVE